MDALCGLWIRSKTVLKSVGGLQASMPDLRFCSSSYRWAFVPEVDTEGPACPSDLEENHQEYKPHIVRILELLKLKYGVNVFLFKMWICGRGEKG